MSRIRVREMGLELGTLPAGKHNAITDVGGVGVGHSTLIEGDSIRTGVTAIVPHQGNLYEEKVTAAADVLNGYGKTVGLTQIRFEGNIETPVLLTETLNTWKVADASVDYWTHGFGFKPLSVNTIVGETNGGYLTDNYGRHVGREMVFEAIDRARSKKGLGAVDEGNVGGGTPMSGYGFKGGIGTSSRRKEDLTIAGAPVGREVSIPEKPEKGPGNSIMMIVATNVALDSRQLWKVAKRTAMGLARTGSYSGNSSGDFTIAFTTGKLEMTEFAESDPSLTRLSREGVLSPLYLATVEATEEAILNALFKAETMTGFNGHVRYALPLDETRGILEKYGRI